MDFQNKLYGDAKATARTDTGDRKTKEMAQAVEAFEKNKCPETKTALAKAYFDMGRYTEAENLLRDLVDVEKPDMQLLSDLGFTYKNLKENEKAILIFKKLIEMNPRHALARCAEQEWWQLDSNYKPSWMK